MEQYRTRKDVKLYLELLLSLLTIVLFATFALRPTLLTIVDLFKQIDSKKETVAILDTKIDNLNTARGLYNSQESNVQLLREAIPENSDPQQIVKQIEGLKSKHGFRLVTMSIGEADIVGISPKSKENINNGVSYSINSDSSYENIYRMVKDLERLRRPNIIDSISLTKSTLDEGLIVVINANAVYSSSLESEK